MNKNRLRVGQQRALDVIGERIAAREPLTSIVLPTRYGKSDVIRLASILSVQENTSSAAIALSPSLYLQKQLVRGDKIDEMSMRYGLDRLTGKMRCMQSANEHRPFSNGEILLSGTMQLATRRIDSICKLADHQLKTTGLPLVFHIDECHETAENKRRGELVANIVKAGGLVVLHTATAIRADGEFIPGFRVNVLDRKDVRRIDYYDAGDGLHNWRDIYEGERHVVELVADHVTGFKEAWDEQPSPLCALSREVIDVNLNDISSEEESLLLSECSPSMASKYLGKAVRHPLVIEKAVELFTNELTLRQRVNPDAAGIIFTCNDTGQVSNEHAKQIADAIQEKTVDWDCHIVTMKNPEDDERATKQIERFVGVDGKHGSGDVLLVKRMGGAGLDSERIKVVLDLSPVRSVASVIQRLMRVATPWGGTRTGSVITLADPRMESIWRKCVIEEGGAAIPSTADVDMELLEHTLVDIPDDPPPPPPEQLEIRAAEMRAFDDNSGNNGDLGNVAFVNALLGRFPSLLTLHTKAEISEGLEGFTVQPSASTIREKTLDQVLAQKRALINQRLGTLVEEAGVKYSPIDPEPWVERRRYWMNAAKVAAGVPLSVKLENITNATTLDVMLNYLAR